VRLYPEALAVAKYFMDRDLPVAAICHGQQILISIKALGGRNCTCYRSIKDDVENAGGMYRDEAVVVDKNLITARMPDDLPYFMRAFMGKLQK
jgi:protease I